MSLEYEPASKALGGGQTQGDRAHHPQLLSMLVAPNPTPLKWRVSSYVKGQLKRTTRYLKEQRKIFALQGGQTEGDPAKQAQLLSFKSSCNLRTTERFS